MYVFIYRDNILYVYLYIEISEISFKSLKLWAGSCLWMNRRMFCALGHTLKSNVKEIKAECSFPLFVFILLA